MEIKSIDIKYHNFSGFTSTSNDGLVHVKQLPFLSIVQPNIGSYGIKLDTGKEYICSKICFFRCNH